MPLRTAGYSFEAVASPWADIAEGRWTRVGVHGVAAYVDGDGVVATGPGDAQHPRDMAWVPSEPELALIEQVLQSKGLTTRSPDVELVADLTGDGIRERVAVWENLLTICGTSFLGGTGFFFRDLGGELVKLDARDVTGRGKADVIVRRRRTVGDATREYIEVLSAMNGSEEPRITFAHEIAIRQSDKHIDNSVHLARGPDRRQRRAFDHLERGVVSPAHCQRRGTHPLALGWRPISQVFRFDGSHFATAKQVAQREQNRPERRYAGATPSASSRAAHAQGVSRRRSGGAGARSVPQDSSGVEPRT